MVVLLEPAIAKCAEKSRTNIFPTQAAEDLQLILSINEMGNPGPVNSEQKFSGRMSVRP
jgi:hypothetical protein